MRLIDPHHSTFYRSISTKVERSQHRAGTTMDGRTNFDINDALKNYLSDPATIATPEADGALQDCENDPESLTIALINNVLNPIIISITENPEALSQSSTFDSLQFLLKCAPISLKSQQNYASEPDCELFKLSRSTALLPPHSVSKIFDLVVSGLAAEADVIHNDIETDEQDAVQQHKQLLEMYGFLLQWTISVVETKASEKPAAGAPARGRAAAKGGKGKTAAKDGSWDSASQLQAALDTMCKVLKLKLGKVFMTTSERDTFVQLFTRSVYLVFESEQRTKNNTIRMHAFKVLCIAVKHHGHAYGMHRTLLVVDGIDMELGAQTSIIQNLSYFEHLSEPMAEFLHILSEQYDYPQLAEEVLRYKT